jgi:hypothetical protein
MTNVAGKVIKKFKTDLMLSNLFYMRLSLYEKMLEYVVELDRPQITIEYGACALGAG